MATWLEVDMALGKSCSDECLLETVGLDTLEGVEHLASLVFLYYLYW